MAFAVFAAMLTSCGDGKSPSDLIKKVFGGEPTEQTEEVVTETTEVGTASGEFDRRDAKKLKVIKVEYNNSLAPQAGNTYEAKNLIDGKSQTAWAVSLDKAGFDQIPTGSNWSNDENFGLLVKFCKENLSSERLLGYLQTNWHFEHENPKQHILNSIKLEAEAK